MANRMLSNSEMTARFRNRGEEKYLEDKLVKISKTLFSSKDSIKEEMQTWRHFVQKTSRNSGWSPRSLRPEMGEDVLVPNSTSRTQAAAAASKDNAKLHRMWAYTYSDGSHNKVYRELHQVGANSQKNLGLRAQAPLVSSDLAQEENNGTDHPRLATEVFSATGVNKVKTAWGRMPKLLSQKSTDPYDGDAPKPPENKNLAHQVSKMNIVNKAKSTWLHRDTANPRQSTGSDNPDVSKKPRGKEHLVRKVSTVIGLKKSMDAFCSHCGSSKNESGVESKMKNVVLSYNALQRAKSVLTSKKKTSPDSDEQEEIVTESPTPKWDKCSCNCGKLRGPLSQTWTSSDQESQSSPKHSRRRVASTGSDTKDKAFPKTKDRLKGTHSVSTDNLTEGGKVKTPRSTLAPIETTAPLRHGNKTKKDVSSPRKKKDEVDSSSRQCRTAKSGNCMLQNDCGDNKHELGGEKPPFQTVKKGNKLKTDISHEGGNENMKCVESVERKPSDQSEITKCGYKKEVDKELVAVSKTKETSNVSQSIIDPSSEGTDCSLANNESIANKNCIDTDTDIATTQSKSTSPAESSLRTEVDQNIVNDAVCNANESSSNTTSKWNKCKNKTGNASTRMTESEFRERSSQRSEINEGHLTNSSPKSSDQAQVKESRPQRKYSFNRKLINLHKASSVIKHSSSFLRFESGRKHSIQPGHRVVKGDDVFTRIAKALLHQVKILRRFRQLQALEKGGLDKEGKTKLSLSRQESLTATDDVTTHNDKGCIPSQSQTWFDNLACKTLTDLNSIKENSESGSSEGALNTTSQQRGRRIQTWEKAASRANMFHNAFVFNGQSSNGNTNSSSNDNDNDANNNKNNSNSSDNNNFTNCGNKNNNLNCSKIDNQHRNANIDSLDVQDSSQQLENKGTKNYKGVTANEDRTTDDYTFPKIEQKPSRGLPTKHDRMHRKNAKATYHRGIRLSNYVNPQLRYKTVDQDKSKRGLSIRWHSSVGVMVSTHQPGTSQSADTAVFSKDARQRALTKMVEENHAKGDEDEVEVISRSLRARIERFMMSVEPFCQSPTKF